MRFFELVVLRGVLWVGLPLALVVLAVGPGRVWKALKQGWKWLTEKRQDPERILTQVVHKHQKHVAAVRRALAQAEVAEAEIVRNSKKSEENITFQEEESRRLAALGDDLGARAALSKLNLEQQALATFQEHLDRQRKLIGQSRQRLYLLELQLRQYEIGRSILLSQLAEAKTAEQQYAIANQFDPFSAVANWQRAEDLVQENLITARAAERVHVDTADLTLANQPTPLDPAALDAQLAALKAKVNPVNTEGDQNNGNRRRNRLKDHG